MDEKTFRKAVTIKQDMSLDQRIVDKTNEKIKYLKDIAKSKYKCVIEVRPPSNMYSSIDISCVITDELLKILVTELEAEKSGCEKELKELQKEFEKL